MAADTRMAGDGHFVRRGKRMPVLEIPVCPCVNARIRFSAMNPVSTGCLSAHEALDRVTALREEGAPFARIVLAGPGDPLASCEQTLETVKLLHRYFPEIPLALKTLGIAGERHAPNLAPAGITHIDLQVNAVTEATLEKLYAWIRPERKTIRLPDAAKILLAEQRKAVQAFKLAGMTVSVLTTIFPGNNEDQVPLIARQMADEGADDMILAPYQSEEGAEIRLLPLDVSQMNKLRASASRYIRLIAEPMPVRTGSGYRTDASGQPRPTTDRPHVAVVSSDGMDIDLHLGEAIRVLIYGPREDGLICLLGSRPAPEPGGGKARWDSLADTLPDCFALLAAGAGENPRKILGERGINVLITDDNVAGTVDVLYGGGKKKKSRTQLTASHHKGNAHGSP